MNGCSRFRAPAAQQRATALADRPGRRRCRSANPRDLLPGMSPRPFASDANGDGGCSLLERLADRRALAIASDHRDGRPGPHMHPKVQTPAAASLAFRAKGRSWWSRRPPSYAEHPPSKRVWQRTQNPRRPHTFAKRSPRGLLVIDSSTPEAAAELRLIRVGAAASGDLLQAPRSQRLQLVQRWKTGCGDSFWLVAASPRKHSPSARSASAPPRCPATCSLPSAARRCLRWDQASTIPAELIAARGP